MLYSVFFNKRCYIQICLNSVKFACFGIVLSSIAFDCFRAVVDVKMKSLVNVSRKASKIEMLF